MPEPFRPRLLVSLRLALDGGPCPLLALLGAHHAPACGALGQLTQLAAPPVARPVGAAVPALQGREPLLHEGLRRRRRLTDPAHPLYPRSDDLRHGLRAVQATVS